MREIVEENSNFLSKKRSSEEITICENPEIEEISEIFSKKIKSFDFDEDISNLLEKFLSFNIC
jgi:hypothetical protein